MDADEINALNPEAFEQVVYDKWAVDRRDIYAGGVAQFLDGLDDTTRAALLGNAGTLAAFRCSPRDAAVLAPHFDDLHQGFNPVALQEAAIGEAWVNGVPVHIPPPRPLRPNEVVKRQSRLHFGTPRAVVEANIQKVLGRRE